MATVSFTEMKHGTQEDYAILQEFEHEFNAKTAHRLYEQLERQGHQSIEGYAISRLEHGLQSATRAWREGANDDSFQSLLGLAALTTSDFCEPRLIGHNFYCR